MPLPLPPAELHSSDEDRRLPPGTGLMIALAISMVCWGAIAAVMALA